MTNPDNAIGTNGAFGGRTSPNAFNDVLSGLQGDTNDGYKGGGILSGWAVSATSADQITLGGSGLVRDVAIASDPSGNLVTVNNISGQPISVTMPAKPTSGSRSDGVIAYVQNPPQGTNIVVDNPGACGIIGVAGTGYQVLSDQTIREAITADGGDGANAYYVVLATVVRYYRETTINQAEVKTGKQLAVQLLRDKFPLTPTNVDNSSFTPYWDTIVVQGTGNNESTSLNVKSTMGNQYTVEIINSGDSIQLASASNISQIETFTNAVYDGGMPGNLRVRKVGQNTTVVSKEIYNITDGTVRPQGVVRYTPELANGIYVANVGPLRGNCTATTTHTVCNRIGNSQAWSCFVETDCQGADSAWSGMAQCTMSSLQYAPAFYKGQTEGHITRYDHIIKVLRSS